jgi:hypothetical protein
MLIVLNQIDKLPPETVAECVDDLIRLIEADGLTGVPVLAVSARTGLGLDELRRELAERVAGRRAAADRLAADVDRVAARLAPLMLTEVQVKDPAASAVTDAVRAETVEGLRAAAGVAGLADAVGERVGARASAAAATPLWAALRLLRRTLAPAPAATVSPITGPTPAGPIGTRGVHELVRATAHSPIAPPAPVPVDRGALETVLIRLADALTADLPTDWGRAAHVRITDSRVDLADRIDVALADCELDAQRSRGHDPIPWAHGGLLLLTALGLGSLAVRELPIWVGPTVAGLGLFGSTLLDVVGRSRARVWARAAGRIAAGQLSVELSAVAEDTLFAPATAELERYQTAVVDFGVVQAR